MWFKVTLNGCGSVLTRSTTSFFADDGSVLVRSEEHTSELQSQSNLVCRLLLEKKKKITNVLATLEARSAQTTMPPHLTTIQSRSDVIGPPLPAHAAIRIAPSTRQPESLNEIS